MVLNVQAAIFGIFAGWNDVGFHGSDEIPTPNIDALAYNGVIFHRHYSLPACTPSRAALLTGQYPIRLGFQGRPINPGEDRFIPWNCKTLPAELKKLGYKTHSVGKWHLGYGYRNTTPFGYGFDSHYGYLNGYIGYFNHKIAETGVEGYDFFDNEVPIFNATGKYATDLFTNRALEIIETHPENVPLHLIINHLAAHTGYDFNKETNLEVINITETNVKYSHIKDETRRMLADVVEKMDHSIGQVIKKLEERNMLDDSIIVFLSDNGGPTYGLYATRSSNYPLRGIKQTFYEGAIRVPAALYYKKLKNRGWTYNNLFHISDWVPTLYAAAGGNPKVFTGVDGVNQWNNIASNENENVRDEMLVNIDEILEMFSYIGYNGRYKLIKSPARPFDNYTGSAGCSRPNYLSSVVNSLVNKAINMSNRSQYEQFRKLRKEGTIGTRPSINPPNCSEWCIFDLLEDPFESRNIYEERLDVFENLIKRLHFYDKQLVPQYNRNMDPRSNPESCRGSWYSWLDGAEGCYFNRTNTNLKDKI